MSEYVLLVSMWPRLQVCILRNEDIVKQMGSENVDEEMRVYRGQWKGFV